MWDHVCEAERVRGGRCTRRSSMAYWCWGFQGERFERGPVWVEVCGNHAIHVIGQVTCLEIRR